MHRRLPLCVAVLAVVGATGCAARSPSPSSSSPRTAVAVVEPPPGFTLVRGPRYTAMVPTTIAGLTWTGYRVDYPDRALGTLLHYRAADSLQADLYVYPSPVDGGRCGAACAESLAEGQAIEFAMGYTLTQLRSFESAEVRTPGLLVPAAGERWLTGRLVQVRGTRRGRAAASDFYLFLPPQYFVKVRATYIVTPGAEARVEMFARAAAAGVVPAGSPAAPIGCPDGLYTGPTQSVAATLVIRPDTVFAVARRAVASLGYGVLRADTTRWFLVTEPRFTTPPVADSVGPSPLQVPRGESGIRVVVRLTPGTGDSTRLQVDGGGLCNVTAVGATALRETFRAAADEVFRRVLQLVPGL